MSDRKPVVSLHTTFENNQDLIRKVIYLVRRLVQSERTYSKKLHKKYQVSSSQLNCLLALHENGPLSPSRIARLILVKSSTVANITNCLERKGLVKKERNFTDRRGITVMLTDAGKRFANNPPPPIQRNMMDGLKNLPKTEIEKIVSSLEKLTRMLEI